LSMKTRFTCHGDGRRPPRPHGGTCCWNRETTDVWFAIRGANLNLDEQGNVESVWDAAFLIVSGRGVLPGADPGLVVDARNDLRELRARRAPRRLGGDARVSCGEPRTEWASGRRVAAVTHATAPARRLLRRVASTGKRRCDRPARRGVARARRALQRASFRTSACTAAALDLVLRPEE